MRTMFAGTGIECSLEDSSRLSRAPYRIEVRFTAASTESEDFRSMLRVEKILQENDLELGSPFSAYGKNIAFEVNQRFVDGKINWRRWLPNPEKFSKENTALLDKMSEFRELQASIDSSHGDSLEKFARFVSVAASSGLITDEERSRIQGQYYTVAN